MDTSEQYIKMCEKAEEIQPELQPFHMMESGKGLFYDFGDVWFAYIEGGITSTNPITKVWLPRQDQLQEMVADKHWNWIYKSKRDGSFAFCGFDGPVIIAETMEQLWLAFVMKEKYNKIWNGEDWVE